MYQNTWISWICLARGFNQSALFTVCFATVAECVAGVERSKETGYNFDSGWHWLCAKGFDSGGLCVLLKFWHGLFQNLTVMLFICRWTYVHCCAGADVFYNLVFMPPLHLARLAAGLVVFSTCVFIHAFCRLLPNM